MAQLTEPAEPKPSQSWRIKLGTPYPRPSSKKPESPSGVSDHSEAAVSFSALSHSLSPPKKCQTSSSLSPSKLRAFQTYDLQDPDRVLGPPGTSLSLSPSKHLPRAFQEPIAPPTLRPITLETLATQPERPAQQPRVVTPPKKREPKMVTPRPKKLRGQAAIRAWEALEAADETMLDAASSKASMPKTYDEMDG